MAQLFISYASEDAEFASNLSRHLNELGHSTWRFDEGIQPGQRWQESILEKLKDKDYLLLLISAASTKSSWVNHEIGAALAYSRERGKPLFLPIVLDDAPIPSSVSHIQALFVKSPKPDEVAIQIASVIDEQEARQKAKEEKLKAEHQHVESSAAVYIEKSLNELKERESTYRRLAYFWYGLAYITLLVSVGFGVWRALVVGPSGKEWHSIVELAISGIVVIGLLVALAKYAFTLGKSFMVEALRNADRRHAISFGEFYLRAYGANSEWKEVKEAFQQWNIDKGSHFIGQNSSEFDPQIITLAMEIAKVVSGRGYEKGK